MVIADQKASGVLLVNKYINKINTLEDSMIMWNECDLLIIIHEDVAKKLTQKSHHRSWPLCIYILTALLFINYILAGSDWFSLFVDIHSSINLKLVLSSRDKLSVILHKYKKLCTASLAVSVHWGCRFVIVLFVLFIYLLLFIYYFYCLFIVLFVLLVYFTYIVLFVFFFAPNGLPTLPLGPLAWKHIYTLQ